MGCAMYVFQCYSRSVNMISKKKKKTKNRIKELEEGVEKEGKGNKKGINKCCSHVLTSKEYKYYAVCTCINKLK